MISFFLVSFCWFIRMENFIVELIYRNIVWYDFFFFGFVLLIHSGEKVEDFKKYLKFLKFVKRVLKLKK